MAHALRATAEFVAGAYLTVLVLGAVVYIGADVGATTALLIIAGYALVYCLPCLLLLLAGAARGDRVRRRLGSLYECLGAEKNQPRSVFIAAGYLVAAAGLLTIAVVA